MNSIIQLFSTLDKLEAEHVSLGAKIALIPQSLFDDDMVSRVADQRTGIERQKEIDNAREDLGRHLEVVKSLAETRASLVESLQMVYVRYRHLIGLEKESLVVRENLFFLSFRFLSSLSFPRYFYVLYAFSLSTCLLSCNVSVV